MAKIKWLRIKRFAVDHLPQGVNSIRIHATTAIARDVAGYLERQADRVSLLLNVRYAKTEAHALVITCHELAHLINDGDAHNEAHEKKKKELIENAAHCFDYSLADLEVAREAIEQTLIDNQ